LQVDLHRGPVPCTERNTIYGDSLAATMLVCTVNSFRLLRECVGVTSTISMDPNPEISPEFSFE